MQALTDDERTILAIEAKWWRYAGIKEGVIRDELGISTTVYYQRLNLLLDSEAALAHDPHTMNRLRRVRDRRQLSRSARRIA